MYAKKLKQRCKFASVVRVGNCEDKNNKTVLTTKKNLEYNTQV